MSVVAARAGTVVAVLIELHDMSQPARPLYDPSNGVTILLTDPNGNVALNNTAMTKLSVGLYRAELQTSPNSVLGKWIAKYTATDGGASHVSHDFDAFVLVDH